MKKTVQTIPKMQKDIIFLGLNTLETALKEQAKHSSTDDAIHHTIFDIMTLKALLKYEVAVTLTEAELNTFTGNNGVDFPEYIELKSCSSNLKLALKNGCHNKMQSSLTYYYKWGGMHTSFPLFFSLAFISELTLNKMPYEKKDL